LLTISAATSAAAFEAWPAAAALPVSGYRMPILTASAAVAAGTESTAAATSNMAAIIADGCFTSSSPPTTSGLSSCGCFSLVSCRFPVAAFSYSGVGAAGIVSAAGSR